MQLFCLEYTLFCSLLVSVKGTPKISILIEACKGKFPHTTHTFAGSTPLITPASGAIPLGRSEVEYTCLCSGLFQQWLVTVPSLGAALALVPDGTPAIASLLRSRGIATALGKPYVLLVNATSESNGSSFVCTSIESGVAVSSTPLTIVVYGN